ncbi:MAG: response regulator [Myxococcota bacterium]
MQSLVEPTLVLLVDDNPLDVEFGRIQLERCDYVDAIEKASSGEAALRHLEKSIAEGRSLPGTIFLDLRMPRMDGFEFLDALTEQLPEYRPQVVILTGCASDPDRLRALSHDLVVEYIIKPIMSLDATRILRPAVAPNAAAVPG